MLCVKANDSTPVVVNQHNETYHNRSYQTVSEQGKLGILVNDCPQDESSKSHKHGQSLEPEADKSDIVIPHVDWSCRVNEEQNNREELPIRGQEVKAIKVDDASDAAPIAIVAAALSLGGIEL
jgi:hypothetical protein